jgi:hypothetical protein
VGENNILVMIETEEYTNIVIHLDAVKRKKLIRELGKVFIRGGQLIWGYDVQRQRTYDGIVYFRKVKLNGEQEMYSGTSYGEWLYICKRLLKMIFFPFMGIMFIISFFI